MEVVIEVGAGLDVHKKTVVACCIDGQMQPPRVVKRTFGTFRCELERLRSWLIEQGCTHVAMESTGVYWVPVYRVLEQSLHIVLGNARHMANVPGRKTDMSDAEWIGQLLRHGLIRPNFVPPKAIRELRQLTRYRRKLVPMRTASELRVEKLLQSTNIKLSSVASEIFGVSGRLMMNALAKGVVDPAQLAELSRGKLRKKRNELRLALDGSLTAEDGQFLDVQLAFIGQIEAKLSKVEALIEGRSTPYAEALERLDTIPGIDHRIALEVVAETGTDMTVWPSDRHFAAWSGTCPGNRESAGVHRQTRAREGNRYLKSILCQAATAAVLKRNSYLAGRYGRLARRRGPRRAVLAIAHELALAVYHVLRSGTIYRAPAIADPIVARQRRSEQLVHELRKLGFEVSLSNT